MQITVCSSFITEHVIILYITFIDHEKALLMAGIALKRSIQPCIYNDPSRGGFKKKFVNDKWILYKKLGKKIILKSVN